MMHSTSKMSITEKTEFCLSKGNRSPRNHYKVVSFQKFILNFFYCDKSLKVTSKGWYKQNRNLGQHKNVKTDRLTKDLEKKMEY